MESPQKKFRSRLLYFNLISRAIFLSYHYEMLIGFVNKYSLTTTDSIIISSFSVTLTSLNSIADVEDFVNAFEYLINTDTNMPQRSKDIYLIAAAIGRYSACFNLANPL